MSGPGVIRLKRKRDQQPPDTLIVEPQRKRVQGVDGGFRAHYVRRQETAVGGQSTDASSAAVNPPVASTGDANLHGLPKRRIFKIRPLAHSDRDSRSGGAGGSSVATVIETRTPQKRTNTAGTSILGQETLTPAASPLKRPGRGAVTPRPNPDQNSTAPGTINVQDASQLQAIANSLSQFADDELSKSTKPKLLSTPKLSGLRSREIHQQRSASASISQNNPSSLHNDIDMLTTDDPDHDYVYDTYILSSHPPSFSPSHPDTLPTLSHDPSFVALPNVGYIVITDEDAALWDEFLLESEAAGINDPKTLAAGGDEDDEDENAEDWYGAEYPEDEVASDDEFGRDAYQYRRGSGEEEWDGRSDEAEWSDGEEGGGGKRGMGMAEMLKMTPEEFLRRLGEEGGDAEGE